MKEYWLSKVAITLAAIAILLLANASTTLAVEAVYDFEALTTDLPLGGQDAWERTGGSYAYVVDLDGSRVVTSDRGTVFYRENDGNFRFPGIRADETAAVMELDVLYPGEDPAGGAAIRFPNGPSVGIAGIGAGPNQFYARGASGPEYGVSIGSAASPGDWIRMRLEMDMTSKVAGYEDLSPGVGALSYMNLTQGQTAYTTALADIPLDIFEMTNPVGGIGGGMNLQYWTGAYPIGQLAVDNIRVETAADWDPSPPTPPNPPTNYSQTIMTDSPTAYWRLSDPVGSFRPYEEVAQDYRGFWGGGEHLEQPGALSGEPTVTSTGYRSTGPTMSTPGNDIFAGQTQLTLEMWIKPVGGDSLGVHYFEWGWSDFSLEGSEPTPNWYVNNTNMGTADLTSEEWAHMAFVFDGDAGEARIYKNGQEVSLNNTTVPTSITTSPSGGLTNFMLANLENYSPPRYVDGDFQELAIFQQALTAEQILAHYEAATGTWLGGDFNFDKTVDVTDLGILATYYGTLSGATVFMGDANDDGAVDVSDLGILATNYGTSQPAATLAVPEPSTVALLLGALAMALLGGRRHAKERIMNHLGKALAALLVAAVFLGSSNHSMAVDVTYDFESLTGGTGVLGTPLDGQDNWQRQSGSFAYVTTLDGSQVVNADRNMRILRANDVNFDFPGLGDTESAAVMEVDIKFAGEDPAGGAVAYYSQGPWLGMANIGAGLTQFYMRGANGGTEYGVDVSGRATAGEWVRMRLDMDLTAGNGLGQLSYKNLTRGETSYTSLLTDVDLGATTLGQYGGIAGDMNVWFYADNHPLLNVAVDNIRVQSAADWELLPPNPLTNYSQNILVDNPAAYWRLAEPVGAYRPWDEVSGDFRGNFGGGEQFEQPGALPAETQITATGYHTQGNTASFPVTDLMGDADAFTLELWVRPVGDTTSGIHWFEGGLSDFSLEGTQLHPNWYINNTKAGEVTLTDGIWQHLAFVFDGTAGTAKMYQDGVMMIDASGMPSAINAISTFYLGSRGGTQRFVDADFQELAMFDRALTLSEIQDHYNAASPPAGSVPEPGALILLLSSIGLVSLLRPRRS